MSVKLILFLAIVQLSSKFYVSARKKCTDAHPYDKCSSNVECGCLPFTRSNTGAICAYLDVKCADLRPCENDNRTCIYPREVCVKHSRCSTIPLCYPLDTINEELCPPMKSIGPSSISLDNDLCETTTWTQSGILVAGGNDSGSALNQLYNSHSFFIDIDQSFYIADTENNRVIRWIPGDSQGEIVAGNNTGGSGNDQLYKVLSVVVKRDGTMFICDGGNERLMRWYKDAKQGQTIIEEIECRLLALDDQESLYIMTDYSVIKWNGNETIISNDSAVFGGIFIDKNKSIFVSDRSNNYVLKYPPGVKEGIVVAGNGTQGNGTNQLYSPQAVFVDQMENVYVIDGGNNRIVRWLNGSNSGSVIVHNIGKGYYNDYDFSFGLHGNFYLLDYSSIRMYTIDKNICIQG